MEGGRRAYQEKRKSSEVGGGLREYCAGRIKIERSKLDFQHQKRWTKGLLHRRSLKNNSS